MVQETNSLIFSFNMQNKKLKPLYIYIILSIVLLFIVEELCDFFIKNNYDFKTSYISSGEILADVLIQGSSRAETMFNAELFEQITGNKTYNLGMLGGNIEQAKALLELYLLYNPVPQYIFYELTPYYLKKPDPLTFNSYLFIPHLKNAEIRKYILKNDRQSITLNYFPLLKYSKYNTYLTKEIIKGGIQTITGKKEINFEKGFNEIDINWDGNFDAFIANNPTGIRIERNPETINSLKKYIEFVSSKGIKLFFYHAPILSEYLYYELNREEVIRFIDSMCTASNLEYLRFDTLEMNNNRDFFYNASHTNATGTSIFSEHIANYFVKTIEE